MVNKTIAPLMVGFLSTLVGIGLSRFAFTPLIPALSVHGWFTPAQASYLGSANLVGYLLGALSAHKLSQWLSSRHCILVSLILVILSFLLCVFPGSFLWFLLWRFLAGVGGAVLMVLGPSVALHHTPENKRHIVATLTFFGIGLGIVLSAIGMPYLLSIGLTTTWAALGVMTLLASFICLNGLRRLTKETEQTSQQISAGPSSLSLAAWVVIIAYCCDAIGFVPHTIFWIDYLELELHINAHFALSQWIILGCGALSGPLIASLLVRHLGWHYALVSAYLIKTLAITIVPISHSLIWLSISSFGVGAMIPAVVSLTSGNLLEIAGMKQHKKAWGIATAGFAIAQALAGILMSYFYEHIGSYAPLFPFAASVMAIGMITAHMSRYLKQTKKQWRKNETLS